MGAQKSVHAGKAKIDLNVDFSHMLCEAFLLQNIRNSNASFNQVIGRLSIRHPSLFGRGEKLDVVWDKGIDESNILITFRCPRPGWLSNQSFVVQRSMTPEIAVHGVPIDNFARSGSRGINLCCFSFGVELNEPASSNWRSTTSVKFEHICPVNSDGHPINRDLDGFPITSSGNRHDSMVVLKQETEYTTIDNECFSRLNFQMEQGLPLLPRWLIFNRFKFVASKGIRLGPTFLVTSLTGGSIVGDMAPYQAFAIGGMGSVRGYGEGAIGSGRSFLVANSEINIPLTKQVEGTVFLDCGTDLGSGRHVPGNPALRHGKPGFGAGIGYGVRFNSNAGQLRVDYVVNGFRGRTVYFGVNVGSA